MNKVLYYFLLFFLTVYGKSNFEIISNYPLPENNIREIYQKTRNINQIIDFLKKTDDFEKIEFKEGKLFLERKLRLNKVIIKGNNSFWRREILAITGLIENYPVDLKILHNIYTRLKKFYMDNGFPFVEVNVNSLVDREGNIDVYIEIDEGIEVEVGNLIIYSNKEISQEFKREIIKTSQIKKNELFRLSEITADIDKIQKFLYENNYFDSFVNIVSFRQRKNNVDIVIFIDFGMKYNIIFNGNKHYDEKELKKLLTFKENGFNYYQLVRSTDAIEKFYKDKGFLDVRVIPSFQEDYKELKTDIIFSIEEGVQYRISEIAIKTDFIPVEIKLKRLTNKPFDKEMLRRILNKYYVKLFNEGYLNVRYSIKEEIDRNNKTVKLIIVFEEGAKFILRSLKILGANYQFEKDLPRVYKPEEILKILQSVKKNLKDNGYLDADAYLNVNFFPTKRRIFVDAIIEGKKGDRYKNGITFIYGTWHLKTEVIEKNLSQDVYYTKNEFDNELDFLYYTSIFDSVNPYLEIDKTKKQVNKLYILHEDKRGSFQGLLGYSSEQKLKISAAVRLKNLFRYGFETSGYVEKTDLGYFYKITFGNRILPKRTGLFASYLKSYQYHSIYDIQSDGYEISGERKPNKWIKQAISLSILRNSLKNQVVFPYNSFKTVKLRIGIIDNHREPKVNPQKGYYLTGIIEKEFRDIEYFKLYSSGRYYFPLWFFIFTQKLSIGYIFKNIKNLPPSERFFLGGVSNFRGFGYEKVAGKNGTGGVGLLLLNTEIRYPLFPSVNLYGFSFIDIGNVYESFSDMKGFKTRKTAGTGVYVPTPVGSFLLDVAFKLDKESGESIYRIEFSINTLF